MTTRRLTERFAFSGGKVDRTGAYPIIRDVLLCGATSTNRRRYKAEAFAGERVKRYNDRPVFLNHSTGRAPRDYQDKIATIENARTRSDGMPVGDLAVNPKHPYAETFLFDAEHKPGSCGMSHVAHCKTVPSSDGWEEVTEAVEVESVDLVCDPATTKGLFENRNRTMPLTVKQLAEWVQKHPKATSKQIIAVKTLTEMEGGAYGDVPAMSADPPADDAEPGDVISAAFESAIMAIVKEALAKGMDKKGVLKTIGKLLDGHGDAKGNGKEAPADEPKEPEEESVKNKPTPADPIAVFSECRKLDYEPTPSELKYLCTLPAAERTAHVTEAKARLAKVDPPKGTSRRPMAGTAGNTQQQQTVTTESKGKIPDWDSWK